MASSPHRGSIFGTVGSGQAFAVTIESPIMSVVKTVNLPRMQKCLIENCHDCRE